MAHCKPPQVEKQNLLFRIFQIPLPGMSFYAAQHHANYIGDLLIQWIMQACHIAGVSVRGKVSLKNKEKIFILIEGDKRTVCLRKALPESFLNEASFEQMWSD